MERKGLMPGQPIVLDAGMYFRFGRLARPGVRAKNCFDAILTGERTSTTRFEADGASKFREWQRLKTWDLVRVWSGPWQEGGFSGRSCIVKVATSPRVIVLSEVNREEWSRAEGWAPAFLDILIAQGKTVGLQVRYALCEAPAERQMGLF